MIASENQYDGAMLLWSIELKMRKDEGPRVAYTGGLVRPRDTNTLCQNHPDQVCYLSGRRYFIIHFRVIDGGGEWERIVEVRLIHAPSSSS